MTKPVTSVAAMMLFKEGAFDLTDPIARWLPEFAQPRVYAKGSALNPLTEPSTEPIRLWHLLTHTSGLTYGFHHAHPVDEMYRAAGFEWGTPPGLDWRPASSNGLQLPLVFQPGSEWNYSVSSDVLGSLVEVVSGQPLDEFFRQRIFGPLGMNDTSFGTEGRGEPLRCTCRSRGRGQAVRDDGFGAVGHGRPDCLSGGGGLVSTAADYHRFTQFLLRRGELDGVRLLSPRTVALMTSNHLPGDVDLEAYGRPLFAEMPFNGFGFGLGFSVLKDAVKAKTLSSPGEFAWGGAASTAFWVDPAEELTAMFFTQLLPSIPTRFSSAPAPARLPEALAGLICFVADHSKQALDMTEDTVGRRRDGTDSNKIRESLVAHTECRENSFSGLEGSDAHRYRGRGYVDCCSGRLVLGALRMVPGLDQPVQQRGSQVTYWTAWDADLAKLSAEDRERLRVAATGRGLGSLGGQPSPAVTSVPAELHPVGPGRDDQGNVSTP